MKHKFTVGLALSALILTCGCEKSIKSDSVALSKGTKAGFVSNPDWQTPGLYGRVIHFDIGDGEGNDCLLAWDIHTGETSLTQIASTGSTTLYQNAGFQLSNAGAISVTQWNGDCTDPYNEVGGVHVIPYDATGNGHDDHLLVYVPGRGILYLIHWANGQWVEDWSSASGIGGYNLTNAYDKIITYDYGAGVRNYLILYRPGGGITWVMHNNSTPSNPNPSTWTWTPVLQSNSGIGSFDMKDPHDQLVTIGGPSLGNMNLAAYTPYYGYIYLINHIANEQFNAGSPGMYARASHNGLPGFTFTGLQDRVVSIYSGTGATNDPENDASMWCYRPGAGMSISAFYAWNSPSNYLTQLGIPSGLGANYPMKNNPYPSTGNYSYIGDHVVPLSGLGYEPGQTNAGVLFYSNGGGQSQLYFPNSAYTAYTQVY